MNGKIGQGTNKIKVELETLKVGIFAFDYVNEDYFEPVI